MRLLLIISLLFSTAIDTCFAEDIFRGVAAAAGIEAQDCADESKADSCADCSGDHDSDPQKRTQNACSKCQLCHASFFPGQTLSFFAQANLQPFSAVSYSIPSAFLSALKRPPKA